MESHDQMDHSPDALDFREAWVKTRPHPRRSSRQRTTRGLAAPASIEMEQGYKNVN